MILMVVVIFKLKKMFDLLCTGYKCCTSLTDKLRIVCVALHTNCSFSVLPYLFIFYFYWLEVSFKHF
jgi:hypothetical protein